MEQNKPLSLADELKNTREAIDTLNKSRRRGVIYNVLLGAGLVGILLLGVDRYRDEDEEDDRQQELTNRSFLEACDRNNRQLRDQSRGYHDLIEGIIVAFPDLEQEIADGLRQGVVNAEARIEFRDCEQELEDRIQNQEQQGSSNINNN